VRILVAPDSFGGTLTSVEACSAIADGWRTHAPGDDIDLAPLSDGGPGFLSVLHTSLAGQMLPLVVTGPGGAPVPAEILMVNDTAYIESAQSCGLHLIPIDPVSQRRDPTVSSTVGVGECIAAAISAGARRIVVGIGGTGTNDAGAGMLAALGAEPAEVLGSGGTALSNLSSVVLAGALNAVDGVEIVVATDVDVPLLGLRGATNGFGPQKGASTEQVMSLEGSLTHFASLLGRRRDGKDPAVALGAGAGGGLAYGLMHLGGRRVPGLDTVKASIGLDSRIAEADLVITGEGTFDWSSLRGKVVSGVAATAQSHGVATIVMAGRVNVGRREFGAVGIESAYSLIDQAGSHEEAMAHAGKHLRDLATKVARTWSR
jgi:glycerate 2-kinase